MVHELMSYVFTPHGPLRGVSIRVPSAVIWQIFKAGNVGHGTIHSKNRYGIRNTLAASFFNSFTFASTNWTFVTYH